MAVKESGGERQRDPDVHPPFLIVVLSLRIWMAAHQINSIIQISLSPSLSVARSLTLRLGTCDEIVIQWTFQGKVKKIN